MPAAQTRAELRARLERRLGGSALYEGRELNNALQEGLWIVQLLSRFGQQRVEMPGGALAGRRIYRTPDEILLPLRIEYEGLPLGKGSLSDAALSSRSWLSDPHRAARKPSLWGCIGIDRFFVTPAPWTGGGLLSVYGISALPRLTGDEDTFDLNQELSDLALEYAMQPLLLKEAPATFRASAQAYQSLLKKARAVGAWMRLKNPRFWVEETA